MQIVWGTSAHPAINDGIGAFVARNIPGCEGFERFKSMGVIDGDRLVAGVLFHDWNPVTGVMELSAAAISKRWLTRPVLWAMFDYVFNQAGCQMAVLRVSAQNHQENGRGLPRLLKAYGFSSITVPRLYGRDHDGLLFLLTDDDWRGNRFSQRNDR